jgi:hypothetical protein
MQSIRGEIGFFTEQHSRKEYTYSFKNNGAQHRIHTQRVLSDYELTQLNEILASFPQSSGTATWVGKFQAFNVDAWQKNLREIKIPGFAQDLLQLAANAYDTIGNTVLGVVCEYGRDISLIQKLLDMGADIEALDEEKKLNAIYWAINCKDSRPDKSVEQAAHAVKCLIANGVDLNRQIKNYDKTPLEYAESRGFTAAAQVIAEAMKIKSTLVRK